MTQIKKKRSTDKQKLKLHGRSKGRVLTNPDFQAQKNKKRLLKKRAFKAAAKRAVKEYAEVIKELKKY
jgi:hypothetical protein